MHELKQSIKKALDDNNYQAALFISLSIPDICGKLETPDLGNGVRAKRWFTQYLKIKYFPDTIYDKEFALDPDRVAQYPERMIQDMKVRKPPVAFTAEDFWALRNAILHEASDITKRQSIHLTHSGSHMNGIGDSLQLSVIQFANDICNALDEWMKNMRSDDEVWARIESRAKVVNSIYGGKITFS